MKGIKIGRGFCGEREDLPLYGILIPSPSFSEDPPGPYGAGVAEYAESRRPARPGEELQQVVNRYIVSRVPVNTSFNLALFIIVNKYS